LDSAIGADWDRLVAAHSESTPFHSAAWARVICETYGHKPHYVCFLHNDEPAVLIPLIEVVSPFTGRRGVCLPFSDTCGPLVFPGSALTGVQSELLRLARDGRWEYVEVRGGHQLQPEAEAAATFFGHSLPLSNNPDELIHGFHSGARDAIRQAGKNNLTVQLLTTAEAVRAFYKLHIRTRKKHGVPPQPFRFFEKIHQHLIGPGRGFVALAWIGSRAVAGAVFLRVGSKAVYKFAASDPEFARTRANNLVLWEAMRYLIRGGCDFLDFGRTSLANHGLRRFKLSWGAEERMIPYYRFHGSSDRPSPHPRRENGAHNRLFRNLPLALNRLAGAILYPHLD
jgi:CelD/BcsL family acetyltransferase involved in cellulose biosynthesis